MKLAWFLMIVGALCIFQGIALIFTGYYASNAIIIITGICVGLGLGYYPFQYGMKRRRELLSEGHEHEG